MDVKKKVQVAIIGGGPVGMALAVELGLRGVSCAVVERRTEIARIPKGQNLTPRTLEHFWRWGIVDNLRAKRLLPPGYSTGGVTGYRSLNNEFWYDRAGREILGRHFYEKPERLPQYYTEEVLRDRAATLADVECWFGWGVERIEQDAVGVRIAVAEQGGAGREVIEAEYAIGCDGSHSLVREQIGIGRGGADFDQLMVLAVFRSRELHEHFKRFPERSTYNAMDPDLKGYWQFFGRVDVGEGWFFHAPVPLGTTRANYDFKGLVQRAAGVEFACEFDHVGFWDMRISVADRYRVGRVFIAGDAAHSHPPYGGYGLNSGLEDAVNLGWKLAATLQGWGSDALLDSYGDERRQIFHDTAEEFIAGRIERDREFLERYTPERDRAEFQQAWSARTKGTDEMILSYDPQYEGSAMVWGPTGGKSGAHGVLSFAAQAGHHLAPQTLSSGRNVFEALGPGFTLLAFGAEEDDVVRFEQAAGSLRIPLAIVRDSFADGREAYGSRLVLVRPDQFVAWTGDHLPDDAGKVIGKAAGRTR